jgi:hypothetical protein
MTSILHFYPNGEFTQGFDVSRKPGKTRAEKFSDKIHDKSLSLGERKEATKSMHRALPAVHPPGTKYISPLGTEFELIQTEPYGGIILEGSNSYGEKIEISDPRSIARFAKEEGFTLVHQTPEFSQNNEGGRKKCLKMTPSMGRNIRNAAYLLEQEHGKDCLSFLTLTLPDLPPEDLLKCAHNWSKIVDRFLKWLRTACERSGVKHSVVYCTEVQQKRLEIRGEYALHLHVLFVGRAGKKRNWAVTPRQCRSTWSRAIKGCGVSEFKQSALENLQRVRRSAGAYLSKYLSKGRSGFTAPALSSVSEIPVMHWGGMSRHLCKRIRSSTQTFRGDASNAQIAIALTRAIYSAIKHRTIKFVKTSFIPFNTRPDVGGNRGIWVACGCLRGGMHTSYLVELIEYAMIAHM